MAFNPLPAVSQPVGGMPDEVKLNGVPERSAYRLSPEREEAIKNSIGKVFSEETARKYLEQELPRKENEFKAKVCHGAALASGLIGIASIISVIAYAIMAIAGTIFPPLLFIGVAGVVTSIAGMFVGESLEDRYSTAARKVPYKEVSPNSHLILQQSYKASVAHLPLREVLKKHPGASLVNYNVYETTAKVYCQMESLKEELNEIERRETEDINTLKVYSKRFYVELDAAYLAAQQSIESAASAAYNAEIAKERSYDQMRGFAGNYTAETAGINKMHAIQLHLLKLNYEARRMPVTEWENSRIAEIKARYLPAYAAIENEWTLTKREFGITL